ncbi:hypothetical protein B296_00055582 [Ensete ventricosum]|uniref:Uncharacterized protein n=1 Tax=Ensete ventricosum TaxID=4639 RepID=A0A426XZ58_ENSVE|nr:hypothetical protein B296_00055582 [Ensete ventricosum]
MGAPPHSGSSHNGVQAASTRGAGCRQFEVSVCGCSSCHFDAVPSNIVELFLQDNAFSRVVGSRGGPSDDQVTTIVKGDVRYLLLGYRSFFSLLIEVVRERDSSLPEPPLRALGVSLLYLYVLMRSDGDRTISDAARSWVYLSVDDMSLMWT